jgi:hypothetical protein
MKKEDILISILIPSSQEDLKTNKTGTENIKRSVSPKAWQQTQKLSGMKQFHYLQRLPGR